MKEIYIAPVLGLLSFVSAEAVAYIPDADEVLGSQSSGAVSDVTPELGDVDIEISN